MVDPGPPGAATEATLPTPEAAHPRFFYGWVIMGIGFAAQFIFGISQQAFQTYLVPLGAEFGWNRATLAGPRALTQTESALLGPLNGWAVDRFGPSRVMMVGVAMTGIGLILFAQVQNVWHYYAVNLFMGLGGSLIGLLVISTALNNWFRRKRTMAIAIATMGFSLTGIIAIPAIVWMQSAMGWRAAATASGIAIMVIGFPAAYFLRTRPEDMGFLPDNDPPGTTIPTGGPTVRGDGRVDFTLNEALHTSSFWFLGLSSGLLNVAFSVVMVHLFLHLEQGVRLSRGDAAFAFAFMNVVNIGGRLAGGYLGDRYNKRLILGTSAVGLGLSLVVLAGARSMAPVLVFGVIYGICWGFRAPLQNSQIGDYFGRLAFGRLMGTMSLISSPMGIISPVVAAFVADAQGTYEGVLYVLAALTLLAAASMFLARPPAPPARLLEGST
jgi:MFS family permease